MVGRLGQQRGESFLAGPDSPPWAQRFALRLTGLRATLGSTEFDWRRVVRKDYGTIFSTASLMILLVVRERIVPSFAHFNCT